MNRLSISSSFLVYCHLRCSLDGNLVKFLLNLVKGDESCVFKPGNRSIIIRHNAVVKDESGAVGLTACPAASQRWMLSGPVIAAHSTCHY